MAQVFILFWLACGQDPDPEPPVYDGAWSDAATLLEPLQEHATVTLDGRVIVIGGFQPPVTTVRRVEAYDPSTDAWSELPDLPEKVHHAQAAVLDGSIYVLGVLEGLTMSALAVSWVLDPGADAWAELTVLPEGTERGGGAAVALDGRVHVVGGLRSGTAVAEHHAYDPETDRWEALASMDEVRDHLGAAVIAGRLYAVGGRDAAIDDHTDTLARYDPTTDAWQDLAPMPTPRGGLAVAAAGGRLYAFGGEGNPDVDSGVFSQAEVYDPTFDTWHSLDDMPTPRHGLGAGVVEDRIYLPGGGDVRSLGVVDVHEVYSPE